MVGRKSKASHGKRASTIAQSMQIPLVLLVVIEAILCYAAIYFGGTVTSLRDSSVEILSERTANRRDYLENEMVSRWMNVDDMVNSVVETVKANTDSGKISIEEILSGDKAAGGIIVESTPGLLAMLRRNLVNDVFLVLGDPDRSNSLVGVHLRDQDSKSSPSDNSDILAERAPVEAIRQLDISMDSWWEPLVSINKGDPASDYFLKPYYAAKENPDIAVKDLGYWSPPFKLSENDIEVMTYSVPIRDKEGRVIGVLGTGVLLKQLLSQLPHNELASGDEGAYYIGVNSGEGYKKVLVNGSVYAAMYGDEGRLLNFLEKPLGKNTYQIEGHTRTGEVLCGSVHKLTLYNTNTPFASDEWALISLVTKGELFKLSNSIMLMVMISLGLAILLSLTGVGFISKIYTRPLSKVVQSLKRIESAEPVKLQRLNIQELDELEQAIEAMSQSAFDSSNRLGRILSMTGIQLGAFEYQAGMDKVYCTSGALKLLGAGEGSQSDGFVDKVDFDRWLTELSAHIEERQEGGSDSTYRVGSRKSGYKWVRVTMVSDETGTFGVIFDVTKDVAERLKIEHERDYDLLTSLLNRWAFSARAESLFDEPERLKTAALVMLDLDNLKYINDTYGHDYGDRYICAAADIVRPYSAYGALASRISGDEFLVLFWGYDGREEISKKLEELKDDFSSNKLMPLPDGGSIKVRASAGIAWYPEDAVSYNQLQQFADFAMFRAKNTAKGEFGYFDRATYDRDSYLLICKEDLNRMIDEELLDYHFQPIVDIKTGEILAYEALMRSKLPTLKNPEEIISLARSQSKLYQIEQLTWFGVMKAVKSKEKGIDGRLVFLNSIPNQSMTESDFGELEEEYGGLLPRIVVEITEEEKPDEAAVGTKQGFIKRWDLKTALDDFGTGYNGEATLLSMTPDYIKIDMSLVRGVDTDDGRRQIVSNIISYAAPRGIKLIAEGVETKDELLALYSIGVDYVQGYYIGMPKLEPGGVAKKALETLGRIQ